VTPRPSPFGESSRDRLLETAERLMAENGIEAVSLRQIGAASAQGNNSVVQYHFGDRAGLIHEIIRRRVESFEPQRRALLAAAEANDKQGDIRTLLEIVFLPLAEATDAEGRHVYVRFLMQFLTQFRYQSGIEHPGWSPDSAAVRAVALLGERLRFLDQDRLVARINRVGGMFFSALVDRDNALAQGRTVEAEAMFISDLFDMMAAALETSR
jgi:AcrR family transcriptional regulator